MSEPSSAPLIASRLLLESHFIAMMQVCAGVSYAFRESRPRINQAVLFAALSAFPVNSAGRRNDEPFDGWGILVGQLIQE
jgi:hypothetical protein